MGADWTAVNDRDEALVAHSGGQLKPQNLTHCCLSPKRSWRSAMGGKPLFAIAALYCRTAYLQPIKEDTDYGRNCDTWNSCDSKQTS